MECGQVTRLISCRGCSRYRSAAEPDRCSQCRGSRLVSPSRPGDASGRGAGAPSPSSGSRAPDQTLPRRLLEFKRGSTECVRGVLMPKPWVHSRSFEFDLTRRLITQLEHPELSCDSRLQLARVGDGDKWGRKSSKYGIKSPAYPSDLRATPMPIAATTIQTAR